MLLSTSPPMNSAEMTIAFSPRARCSRDWSWVYVLFPVMYLVSHVSEEAASVVVFERGWFRDVVTIGPVQERRNNRLVPRLNFPWRGQSPRRATQCLPALHLTSARRRAHRMFLFHWNKTFAAVRRYGCRSAPLHRYGFSENPNHHAAAPGCRIACAQTPGV